MDNKNRRSGYFLYELRPVFLITLGIYANVFPTFLIQQVAGAGLLVCGLIIIYMRLKYRGYLNLFRKNPEIKSLGIEFK